MIKQTDIIDEMKEPINDYNKLTQNELNNEFQGACHIGNLNLVKYLLTSTELKNHADIASTSYVGISGLDEACRHGHLDVVKYLLTSTEIQVNEDIHARKDNPFKYALENNHLEVIRFLIFDMNLEKNDYINKHLARRPNESIENMFKIKELNQSHNKELNVSDSVINKPKL